MQTHTISQPAELTTVLPPNGRSQSSPQPAIPVTPSYLTRPVYSSVQLAIPTASEATDIDAGDEAETACPADTKWSIKRSVKRRIVGASRRRSKAREQSLVPRQVRSSKQPRPTTAPKPTKAPNTANCLTFSFKGQVSLPTNDRNIPASQDCTNSKLCLSVFHDVNLADLPVENAVTTTYSHDAIVDAIGQGARYALGYPRPQAVST